MAAHIAAVLTVLAGAVLVAGLLRIALVMVRIARTLTSVRLLSDVAAKATGQLGQFVGDIGVNVRALEDMSEDIGSEQRGLT